MGCGIFSLTLIKSIKDAPMRENEYISGAGLCRLYNKVCATTEIETLFSDAIITNFYELIVFQKYKSNAK